MICKATIGIVAVVVAIVAYGENLTQEIQWSPIEGESTFSPSTSVLERWADLPTPQQTQAADDEPTFRFADPERGDKVIKKPSNSPDRIVNNPPPNKKPQDVSETDLFLLGAIEKLAYRVDFLEKRAKRMEDMIYQIIAGSSSAADEPCPEGFNRHSGTCYHFSQKLLNWKSASSMCRGMGGILLEIHSENNRQQLVASMQSNKATQGNDFWTGGLNPGLLWLWGASAKPVSSGGANQTDIIGNGRCLLLGYQPPTRSYQYKGTDCAARHRYICQIEDNSTERKLRKLFDERSENDQKH